MVAEQGFIPFAELDDIQRAYVLSKDWEERQEAAQHGWGLDTLVDDPDPEVCEAVAWQGYGLEKLMYVENWLVRCTVAAQGYGLDELVDDEHHLVRSMVAAQGHALERLVNDEDEIVRAEVARQGYGLEKLVRDESEVVRSVVTELGYGLDILVDDEVSFIRAEVADQGYGLDKLARDENLYVREHALNRAAEMMPDVDPSDPEKLIAAWASAYPDKCALAVTASFKEHGRFRSALKDMVDKLSGRIQREAKHYDGPVRYNGAVAKIAGTAKQVTVTADKASALDDVELGALSENQCSKDKLAAKMEQSVAVNAARGMRGGGREHGDEVR